jgi:hypothetical protein
MDPFKLKLAEDMLVFGGVVVGMGCFTGIVTSYFKFRRPKQVGSSPELIEQLNEISDRLARLDNAMDAVAVEVERISEAQRFTSKLLAERASGGSGSVVGGRQ